jgi:tetratricopeptide (TPR) repeat protein
MYTLRKLGLALEAGQKLPEAELIHREALAISSQQGNEDPEALVDLERVVRVLTTERKFAQAQQLLDNVLTPAFVAQPASANLLTQRIDVMGRRGRWQEAAADAALAVELQLTEHYRYHTLAALLAMSRDRPAYEAVCKRLVAKFADSNNPFVLERAAQDCLLLPDSKVDLELMDKLADKAVTAGSTDAALPYFQGCKAMSNYRLGNFREAVAWGEKAAKCSIDFAQAKADAVLAMAYWRLGQKDAARTALAQGGILVPNLLPDRGAVDLGDSWVAWLMARISLDEAAELLQTGLTTDKNSNQP